MENSDKAKRRVAVMHTGAEVLANIRYYRERRGMKLADLRDQLAKQDGKQLGVSALSEIENAARRVDVDDLMSIAVALNVPPNALLLPREPMTVDDDGVGVSFATGWGTVDFLALWNWSEGRGHIDHSLYPWEPSRASVATRPKGLDDHSNDSRRARIRRVLAELTELSEEIDDGDD